MSKSIRHDPRDKMPTCERERHDALCCDLLRMTPGETEDWIQQNVTCLESATDVICQMARALNALAYEVRKPK